MLVTKEQLKWYGRNFDSKGIRYFDYSNSGFEFCFTGKKACCKIISDPENWDKDHLGVLAVYVSRLDNSKQYTGTSFWEFLNEDCDKKIFLEKKENDVVLFESEKVETVIVRVVKISEVNFGYAGFSSLEIDGKLIKKNYKKLEKNSNLKIEFIGDSITCGYGIEGLYMKDQFTTTQERSDKAYAFKTAKGLNADFHCVSWSGIGLISKYVDESINIPDTSITMPLLWPYTDKSASLRLGIESEVWDESKFSPDIVVINLGTNDASFVRNEENRRVLYVHNLRVLIEAVHCRSPKAKICCCLGIMGQALCNSVKEAVQLFSKDFPSVKIKAVEFPVQLDEDGIATDWHPSEKSHSKIANIMINELKTL